MRHYTSEELDCLAKDKNVRRYISDFLFTDKAVFFEEVRSCLSAKDLEDFLTENPEYRAYTKK